MRGRIIFYNGNEVLARKQLTNALELDPDSAEIRKAIKNIKLSTELKEKASEFFKKQEFSAAIDKFAECLELDELNVTFNSTIYFNMALAFQKQKKNEDSLKCLNKAIQLNPKYAKAYFKRAEIHQQLSNPEESLQDYQMAAQLDPSKIHYQFAYLFPIV
jgi:tetratricopeptide (TPR) repeat protein